MNKTGTTVVVIDWSCQGSRISPDPMSILWVLGSPSSWLENWGKGSSPAQEDQYQDLLVFAWTSVGFVIYGPARIGVTDYPPVDGIPVKQQNRSTTGALPPFQPCFMSYLAEASTNHGNVIVLASSSASTFPWSVMACCAACTLQGRGHGLKSFLSGRGDSDHRERWCWSENWQDP